MPLKLNVGLAKKIGQPDYGSLSAHCHVEIELDASLLQADLDGFHQRVRGAFTACRQAVSDELARQHSGGEASAGNGNGYAQHSNGNGNSRANPRGTRDRTRRATASQIRAIEAIAKRQRIDLASLLTERFRVAATDDLSIVEASRLIDELKSPAGSNGDGA